MPSVSIRFAAPAWRKFLDPGRQEEKGQGFAAGQAAEAAIESGQLGQASQASLCEMNVGELIAQARFLNPTDSAKFLQQLAHSRPRVGRFSFITGGRLHEVVVFAAPRCPSSSWGKGRAEGGIAKSK